MINKVLELITGEKFGLAKEELQKMSRTISDAWREFGEVKGQMSGRDKHEVYEFLTKVQNEVQAAWAEYKGKRAGAAAERQRVWREGVEARIKKNEDWLEDLHEKIQLARERLTDAEEKRDTAWNESYRDWAEARVCNLENWIEKLQDTIDRVQGWLANDQARLEC